MTYELRKKYNQELLNHSFLDSPWIAGQKDLSVYDSINPKELPSSGDNFPNFSRWYRYMKANSSELRRKLFSSDSGEEQISQSKQKNQRDDDQDSAISTGEPVSPMKNNEKDFSDLNYWRSDLPELDTAALDKLVQRRRR